MTKTSKIALSVLMAGAVALTVVPQSAQATPITGSIAFSGSVVAYANTSGTGPSGSDLTQDHSLVFSSVVVNSNPATTTGSFVPYIGSAVDFYSPLAINPTVNPAPAALWTIHNTLMSFTLITLSEPIDTASLIQLSGTGTFSDGNSADATTGTWTASVSQTGVAFSFESTAATSVPDSGTSLMLLGLGFAALAGFSQFRKQLA